MANQIFSVLRLPPRRLSLANIGNVACFCSALCSHRVLSGVDLLCCMLIEADSHLDDLQTF